MNKPIKHFKCWRVYSWKAAPGEVIPVATPLPQAAVVALGLVPCGFTAEGKATAYMKAEGSKKPDTARVEDSTQVQDSTAIRVYADGTRMPVATTEEDRYEGVRQIVAKACDMDNRLAGGEEYYAPKYPAFVKLSEREHEIQFRADLHIVVERP